MAQGGTALIQVTSSTSPTAAPLVKYVMTYVRCYLDESGESTKIWGKEWRFIIEGRNIYQVKGFDIRRVQVTKANYGQGAIRFAYIRDEDAAAIREGGFLNPLPPL